MAVKAADVKDLRAKTGAGMMECKKALEACNGDAKEAEKYLKEKGLAAVEKRSGRATGEGIIVTKGDSKKLAIVELTCETDFVSGNAEFIATGSDIVAKVFDNEYNEVTKDVNDMILELATRVRENMTVSRIECIKASANEYIASYVHHDKKSAAFVVLKSDNADALENEDVKKFAHGCCLHLVAYTPQYIQRDDVDAEYIKEQNDIFMQQVAELDKPEKVKEGIVKGKMNKHLSEICFLDQMFIDDEKVSVGNKMKELSKSAGGTLSFSKAVLWQLGAK
ncbi:MAG: translation elongation factor Ts [Treponema sp.]|nr:MAG: translation elongation factor Ts [Treponema sp.]